MCTAPQRQKSFFSKSVQPLARFPTRRDVFTSMFIYNHIYIHVQIHIELADLSQKRPAIGCRTSNGQVRRLPPPMSRIWDSMGRKKVRNSRQFNSDFRAKIWEWLLEKSFQPVGKSDQKNLKWESFFDSIHRCPHTHISICVKKTVDLPPTSKHMVILVGKWSCLWVCVWGPGPLAKGICGFLHGSVQLVMQV